jgi:hypothetical protein
MKAKFLNKWGGETPINSDNDEGDSQPEYGQGGF